MSKIKFNLLLSFGLVMYATIATCPLWWYDVPSCVLTLIIFGGTFILTIALTALRELSEALWAVLRSNKRKRIRFAYDSHGMHTDEKRLGYVSQATICTVMRQARR